MSLACSYLSDRRVDRYGFVEMLSFFTSSANKSCIPLCVWSSRVVSFFSRSLLLIVFQCSLLPHFLNRCCYRTCDRTYQASVPISTHARVFVALPFDELCPSRSPCEAVQVGQALARIRMFYHSLLWSHDSPSLAIELPEKDRLWGFCPNIAAAYTLAVLFALTTCVHTAQAIIYRKGYCWVIIMSALWQTVCYVLRILSIKYPASIDYYSGWFVLILVCLPGAGPEARVV